MRGKSSSKNNQNHFAVAKLTPLKEAETLHRYLSAREIHIMKLRGEFNETIGRLHEIAAFENPVAVKDFIELLEKLPVESDFRTNFRKIIFNELPEQLQKSIGDFIDIFYQVPVQKLFEVQHFQTYVAVNAVAKARARKNENGLKR